MPPAAFEIFIRFAKNKAIALASNTHLLRLFIITLELLETLNEHRGRLRFPHLSIEHRVVQVTFRPLQPEILPNECSSRFVCCINQFDGPVLTFAPWRSVCGFYDRETHKETLGRRSCDCAGKTANLGRQSPTVRWKALH